MANLLDELLLLVFLCASLKPFPYLAIIAAQHQPSRAAKSPKYMRK
jgi:hypothetical protein